MKRNYIFLLTMVLFFLSCKKEKIEDETPVTPAEPRLIFKVKLDPQQDRLDNFGQPATIPANHGAQTPLFNGISAHYIELTPNAFTQVGNGDVLYHAPETTQGGDLAIDHNQAVIVQDGEILFSIPISQVTPGTYQYARVSLGYQNYDIEFKVSNIEMTGTVASFVGYNTFITSHVIKTSTVEVNANRLQGYWAWETHPNQFIQAPIVNTGQSAGTTVPNPISTTSPIPPGSCLVTGQFPANLTITGNETSDVVIELAFSINNSFEWYDADQNNIFEPLDGDTLVDMGIRGLIPMVLP
jgi:hypothetical protein